MEHLVTLHHVKMWLQDMREKVPESEVDLIEKCKEIQQKSRMVEYKVINSDDLHFKCKKARIRLTKEAADEIYTRQLFAAPSDNSPVLKQSQSESLGNSKAKKRALKKRKKKTSSTGLENVPLGENRTESILEPIETSNMAAETEVKQMAVDVPDNSVSDTHSDRGQRSQLIRGAGWVDCGSQQDVDEDLQIVHNGGIELVMGGGSHCYDVVHP